MPNGDPGLAGQAVQIQILGQYVKDLSFENPAAPIINPPTRPQFDIHVDLQARNIDPQRIEIEMKLRVSAQNEGKPMFLLELVYAALVGVQAAPPEVLQQVIMIDIPHLIFPFARRIVADAIRDGGMPPLMIEPIDFAALYRSRQTEGQIRAPGQALV